MNANTATFQKQNDEALYFLAPDSSLVSKYCIAFLPNRIGANEKSLGSRISLTESWNESGGLYLFLNTAQENLHQQDFIPVIQRLMRDPAFKETRFIWIENPLAPPAFWILYSLAVSKSDSDTVVSKRAFFNFQNLSLRIARGSQVALNDSRNGFTLTRSTDNADGFLVTTGMGTNRLKGVGDTIELPLIGAQAGCLQFDLTVNKNISPDNGAKPVLLDISSLDISLRFFFQENAYPHTQEDSFITSQRYPFLSEVKGDDWKHFEQNGADLTLFATLDPLNHLNETRTYFSFINKKGNAASGLPTCYRTNMGYTIHLNPQENSRLVFARRPLTGKTGSNDPYYLVPSGDFEMIVPRYSGDASAASDDYDDNLLCGLSGVEYIKLAGEQAHLLSFKPNQNAYAANFSPGKRLASAELVNALQPQATTAWSYVHAQNGLDPIYYAQPEQSVLYNEIETLVEAAANNDLRDDLLEYMEVPSAVLPRSGNELASHLFPMLPYGGLFFPSTTDYHAPVFLFSADSRLQTDLDQGSASEAWMLIFENQGITLNNPMVAAEIPEFQWQIADVNQTYIVRKDSDETLNVYAGLNIAQQLEQQLISPKRRDIIHQINTTVADPVLLPNSYPEAVRVFTVQENLDVFFVPSTTDDHAPISLFHAECSLQNELGEGPVTEDWKRVFEQHGISLTQATVTVAAPNEGWRITDRSRTGVTQQGLLTTFSGDYKTMKKVVLAIDTDNHPLALTEIRWNTNDPHAAALRTALQTAQLFMVVSKPDALKDYFSQNQLTIQGWTFDLNPESWKKHGTLLIFKFNDQPFTELVENPSTWSQPEIFTGDVADTKSKLSNIVRDVLSKDSDGASPKDRENYRKLAQAFRNRYWSGIIALNVNTPPGNLPDELKGIAGAINQEKFCAQYLGIEMTPITVQPVGLVPGQSSLFGLIDYKDDALQTSTSSDYNFQVMSLNVRFQNSEVQAFSCELGVTLDLLFGERTQLQNGPMGRNIVVLKGTAEKHDGHMTYAFNFSGDNRFELPESKVLDTVEIIKAQFSTDPGSGNRVNAHFSFWGRLNFTKLAGFDILSFGAEDPAEEPNEKHLSFSNLTLLVSFDMDQATGAAKNLDFQFNPRNLAIDMKRSDVRDQSLFAKFPLKFTGFIYSTGDKTIESLGYMPVKSPLAGGKLDNQNWYGLTFNLELGSLGALSSSADFVVSIIAAWSPSGAKDKESKGVFVGLRLPGSTGGKKEIVLQGLLKLSFKSIEFLVDNTDPNKIGYLLKLKNIVIKFFVLSMPPSGQTEIIIFGDPNGTPDNKTLGWYAAYAKKKSQ